MSTDNDQTLRWLAVLFFCATALFATFQVWVWQGRYNEVKDQLDEVCMEDMSCWDCETMGNQICGREGN